MQKSKTYCIFAAQYFPHLGGVERYTYNLAKQLIQDGNKVIIVTSNVYHLKNHELVNGIPVYRIPCYNLLEGRYPVIKFNKEFWWIHRKLKSKNCEYEVLSTFVIWNAFCQTEKGEMYYFGSWDKPFVGA